MSTSKKGISGISDKFIHIVRENESLRMFIFIGVIVVLNILFGLAPSAISEKNLYNSLRLVILITSATMGLLFAFIDAFNRIQYGKTKSTGATTQERISQLINALQESTELINAIEVETKERQALVERLKKDSDTYNELVKLHEPEVEAVAQLLRGELKMEGRKSLRRDILVNASFFFLGILVTVALRLF